ncbi:hypothetical protein GYA27_01465 [candidate division WWE3 bacterium]|uniref:PIG-L family deacetylase n=1 Tax=candidate division WWE3 bacterium TaxID=2053526 RepID=A0A7X9DK14_UNCKA|nr:hypothetical protein [candidate division WWE3 bacterium]
MAINDDNNKKLLLISAHADDHIACAGTVFKLIDRGYTPYEVVLTNSQEGPDMRKAGISQSVDNIKNTRKEELSKASKFLGIAQTFNMENEDLRLTYSKDLMIKVMAIVREVKPTIGFLMNSYDWHPDHREAFKIGSEAFKWAASGIRPELGQNWKTPMVLCAEGMIPVAANILVDITTYADKKMQLWKIYDSQATSKSVKFEEGLLQVRGYQQRKVDGFFAEAFSTDPLSPILLFENE